MNTCIKDFSIEQLQELIDNNLKFRDFVALEVYDRECDFLNSDILFDFPSRYEYGCIYATRVDLDSRYGHGVKWDDLIAWIERIEHSFCFLDNVEYKKPSLELAKQARELQEKMDYFDLSDLNYDRIEKKVETIKEELENRIKAAIDSYLDSTDDSDYLKDELELLADYLFDDLYMDESGALYRDIHEIKYL